MKNTLLLITAVAMSYLSFAQQIDTVRIDSIQWKSAADLANCLDTSRYFGDTVVLVGICLVDGAEYGSQSHNTQISMSSKPSPFGGIRFRVSDPNATYTQSIRNLKQGDSIVAVGIMSEYLGETQFQPLIANGSITILNRGVKVEDTVISVAQLNDDKRVNQLTTGEQWESAFITIENVTVETVDFFSSNSRVSFVVSEDATGSLINVGDHFTVQKLPQYTHPVTRKPGKFVPPSPGDKFASISGIVIHNRNCTGENGRGYELHPFDTSHYKYGPSAPRISNEKRNIAKPTSSDDVVVSADIVDLDGQIVKADLHYATGTNLSTPFTTLSMSKNGKTYSATIPKQANGTFVRYYITAEDDSMNVSARPAKDPKDRTYSYRVRDSALSIFDVQYTPFPDRLSPYLDEEVTVTGVVTSSGKDCDLSLIHIQDENAIGGWSGILLTNAGTTFDRGEKITVTGTVQELRTSSSYRTAIQVNNVTKNGTGTIEPAFFAPDTVVNGSDLTREKFESVLIGLVNTTTVGNGKLHVVDTNPDSPSNFAEWAVGRDPFDPSTGARVLTGRSGQSSQYVSYVNASTQYVPDSASYPVEKIVVNDTMNLDTLFGILTETFGNFKLLPRNNEDVVGMNAQPTRTPCKAQDTTISVEEQIAVANFTVYPNPANDVLVVKNLDEFGVLKMRIFDINGREVFVRQTRLDVNYLPVRELETGVYFLQIESAEGAYLGRTKFVKQ